MYSDNLCAEPKAILGKLFVRRSPGDFQQPCGKRNPPIHDRPQELVVCRYAERRQRKRRHLQLGRKCQSKRVGHLQIFQLHPDADARHGLAQPPRAVRQADALE